VVRDPYHTLRVPPIADRKKSEPGFTGFPGF